MWKIAKISMIVPLGCLLMVGCAPDAQEEVQHSVGNELFAQSVLAALPPAGIEPTDLPEPYSDGAQAVANFCTPCHALPHPTSHAETDWPVVMRRMWLRIEVVGDEFAVPIPNAAERLTMTQYMLDNALQVATGDLPDFVGREYFMLSCSQCHALPDPGQHTAQDWPAVISRMQQHMADLLGRSPIPAEMQDITAYLQQVSQ